MSLALRLTLVLSGMVLAVMTAVGAWQIRIEERDLRQAREHDIRLLGRSLLVAFENALRDAQPEDLQETLHELERFDPDVDIFVHRHSGELLAASRTVRRAPPIDAALKGKPSLRFLDEPHPTLLEHRLPLHVRPGEPPLTLTLLRPLDDLQQDLHATRTLVASSIVGLVVLLAVLTHRLARLWVGRPLARMVKQMQRVGRGEPAIAPVVERDDEVGAVLSEFARLVAALAEARARLEAEAEARHRLEKSLRDVDKLATLGQLAAGLAHEIGSPLQVLEGRLDTLQRAADDVQQTRRVAGILREQVQRITRIVSGLTQLARRRPVRRAPIDVVPAVRTVVELLEGEARRRRVALALHVGENLPTVLADVDAVQQIVLNLLRNALDATPADGRIEVRVEHAEWFDSADQRQLGTRIVVKDTGTGMDERTRVAAFESFFTTRADAGGTGLGLAVVKGIVDELRGRVHLSSEPGAGAEVTVDLPSEAPPGEATHG